MEKRDFRILIADDDEIARDVISSLLAREGYPVLSARDGLAAIALLTDNDIRLVITDLKMPGADGLEVLKYAVRKNPDIAVIILTAYGTLDTTLEAVREGAYDYLTKPFKGQEIIIHAERARERALLLHQNRELKQHLREIFADGDVVACMAACAGRHADPLKERFVRLAELTARTPDEAQRIRERLV